MEQGSDFTEGGVDVTTLETERLIRWLVAHGHTYEEAYECIAFMSGKRTKSRSNQSDQQAREPTETWALFMFWKGDTL